MITRLVIAFIFLAVIAYDVFAFVQWGQAGTVSWQMFELSHEFPVITFLAGFICGHLFWRMKDPKELKKGTDA